MYRFSREKIMPLFLEMNITLKALAERAGLTLQAVGNALSGGRMQAPTANKIAKALEVDVLDLLEERE